MSKALQRILYVEDEPDIQRVAKLALEAMAGMHVITCSTGAEAVARAPDLAVDLILLDVMMPGIDGPTTLSRLREIPALENTPVIFMTAKAHPSEIAHFKSLGALGVIPKPFDPVTLAATLQAMWAQTVVSAGSLPAAQEPVHAARNAAAPDSAEARFAARLTVITAQFQAELPGRLDALQQNWRALCESWDIDALDALHCGAHHLAGSGSTFGYDAMTTFARALDRHLKPLLAQQQPPDAVLWEEIRSCFVALEAELGRIVAELET